MRTITPSQRIFISICLLVSQVMPVVQFGTYKLKGEDCYRSVRGALESGYRGLDTASVYDNEKEVGRAVLDSGVPREQVGAL